MYNIQRTFRKVYLLRNIYINKHTTRLIHCVNVYQRTLRRRRGRFISPVQSLKKNIFNSAKPIMYNIQRTFRKVYLLRNIYINKHTTRLIHCVNVYQRTLRRRRGRFISPVQSLKKNIFNSAKPIMYNIQRTIP